MYMQTRQEVAERHRRELLGLGSRELLTPCRSGTGCLLLECTQRRVIQWNSSTTYKSCSYFGSPLDFVDAQPDRVALKNMCYYTNYAQTKFVFNYNMSPRQDIIDRVLDAFRAEDSLEYVSLAASLRAPSAPGVSTMAAKRIQSRRSHFCLWLETRQGATGPRRRFQSLLLVVQAKKNPSASTALYPN